MPQALQRLLRAILGPRQPEDRTAVLEDRIQALQARNRELQARIHRLLHP